MRTAIGEASWTPLLVAIVATAVSYAALSYGFAFVGILFGLRVPRRDLAAVGFLTNAVNNLVSMGGLAGYSLRVALLARRGIRPAEVLAPSLFYSYLNNLLLLALLPAGLSVLARRHPLSPGSAAVVTVAAVLLSLLFLLATLLLLTRGLRRAVLGLLDRAWGIVSRRKATKTFSELDDTLAIGIAAARKSPAALVPAAALVLLDWAACLYVLALCFRAIGTEPSPSVLVTGFAIGIAAGLLSMIPGGLGVQEGSMAGIFALLGVPLERALLASVLFRVVYYFLPFGASLGLYRSVLRGR